MDREALHAAVHEVSESTQLSNWTELDIFKKYFLFVVMDREPPITEGQLY